VQNKIDAYLFCKMWLSQSRRYEQRNPTDDEMPSSRNHWIDILAHPANHDSANSHRLCSKEH